MTQPADRRLLTEAAGNATYGTVEQERRTRVETGTRPDVMPHTLMWSPEEAVTAQNCALSTDLEHYVIGGRGIKLTTSGAVTAGVTMNPMQPVSPHYHAPAQAVVAQVWIEDASKVDWVDVTKRTLNADATTSEWRRTNNQGNITLRDGWNTLRWVATSSVMGDWNNTTYVRFRAITNAATTVTVGHVYLECPRKAKIVMTNDGGHRTFHDGIAVPFHERGWPVTWAIGCSQVEAAVPGGSHMTEQELFDLQERFGDAVSFHNSRGGIPQDMAVATPAQTRTWTFEAQRWLQSRGFTSWPIRGAWFRNNAPNADAADSILAAGPTWHGKWSDETWPFMDRHNYSRRALHGWSTTSVDEQFEVLKKTRGFANYYTHEFLEDADEASVVVDLSPTRFNHFLAKLDQAVAEGWLEVVTVEQLFHRAGARWVSGLDGARFEFTNEAGTTVALGAGAPQSVALAPDEFTPRALPGLKAWYDPRQIGVADGAAVTAWGDRSVHDNDLTAVAGSPTYADEGVNGTPGVRFPGLSSLSVPALNSATGTGPITVAFTATLEDLTTTGSFFRGDASTTATRVWFASAFTKWRYQRAGSFLDTGVDADLAPHVFLVVFDEANSRFEIDGQVVHTGTASVTTETGWSIGGDVDGSTGIKAVVGDMVVVQAALAGEDRDRLTTWLAGRSGIAVAA